MRKRIFIHKLCVRWELVVFMKKKQKINSRFISSLHDHGMAARCTHSLARSLRDIDFISRMICEIKCSIFFCLVMDWEEKHHGGEILKSFSLKVKVVDQNLPEKLADLAPKWTGINNYSVLRHTCSTTNWFDFCYSLIRAAQFFRCVLFLFIHDSIKRQRDRISVKNYRFSCQNSRWKSQNLDCIHAKGTA